jgi:cold shock CspA family protein
MPGAGYGPYGGCPGWGAGPPQQRLFGKLVEWNPEKACGFVECTEPPGKRLFVHKTEFAVPFPDGYEPPLGTPLNFLLGNDPKSGKQRAVDIRIQDAQRGFSGRGRGQTRRRLAGTLEEWNSEKGCGFIHARDTPGKKFFAHKTEFAVPFADGEEPTLGCEVHFVLGQDPRSGKERAQDIQLGPLDESAGLPRLYGTLKEWNSQKACGFIECERPGKTTPGKLFAHKSEFAEPFEDGGEPELGSELSFVLGHDSKSGKERAVDIRLAVPGEEPPSKRPRFGA